MKILRHFVLILCLLSLGGCVQALRDWARPPKPQGPVATMPPHESWCYRTIGRVECYPEPQNLPPETLVSVDPPSRFPLTREAHAKALAEAKAPKK